MSAHCFKILSAHFLIVWGSIKGFLFVRSGAGQDRRVDRAGGESKGLARHDHATTFHAPRLKLCAMINELALKPATQH